MIKGNSKILGLALAGGRSRRMGQDKANLRTRANGNSTMLAHTMALLKDLTCHCIVSCRSDNPYPDYHCLFDRIPDQGPAAGILTGLEYAVAHDYEMVLCLACDLPAMQPPPLEFLLNKHGNAYPKPLATLFRSPFSEKLEMLSAVYSPAAAIYITDRLARGRRALHKILPPEKCQFFDLPKDWQYMFHNCNTPDDLRKLNDLPAQAPEL